MPHLPPAARPPRPHPALPTTLALPQHPLVWLNAEQQQETASALETATFKLDQLPDLLFRATTWTTLLAQEAAWCKGHKHTGEGRRGRKGGAATFGSAAGFLLIRVLGKPPI